MVEAAQHESLRGHADADRTGTEKLRAMPIARVRSEIFLGRIGRSGRIAS
jgi:hypothetical protein